MGRPIVVSVGPLATASATKISLTQKAAIAGTNYLVLNGAGGSFTANSVCASQTPGGAGALTLNGTLASSAPSGTAIAYLPSASRIYITGGSDESGKTFAVVGIGFSPTSGPYAIKETITGPNASTVSSLNAYSQIISITASAGTTGAITVGHYGTATLDVARRIIVTSGGNDTGITFTPSGTDWYGEPISETITGASGAAASSVLSYKTVTSVTSSAAVATTVTVGTNTTADSPWARFDDYAANAQVAIQCDVSGTPSTGGTVRQTLDDPNLVTNNDPPNTFQWTPATVNWVDHPTAALVGFTTTQQGNYAYPPLFAKVVLTTTGSASITAIFRQTYLG